MLNVEIGACFHAEMCKGVNLKSHQALKGLGTEKVSPFIPVLGALLKCQKLPQMLLGQHVQGTEAGGRAGAVLHRWPPYHMVGHTHTLPEKGSGPVSLVAGTGGRAALQ